MIQRPLKVLVSGSSGLIGRSLTQRLRELNCDVIPLVSSQSKSSSSRSVKWNPSAFKDQSKDEPFLSKLPVNDADIDAVVHLGGAPLQPLWTSSMKTKVYESRVGGAKALTNWMANLPARDEKRVLITASGVGSYLRPEDYSGPALTEVDPVERDNNFLAKVAYDSEHACDPIKAQARVVHARFGVVLDPNGGALQQMLLPFKLGLGGPMGSGQQIFPWVSLRDVVESLIFMLGNPKIQGPVNVVSPTAATTTQKQFAQALGKSLNRPAVIPLPGFVLRTVMGREAAECMLLGSMKVAPRVLAEAGFDFKDKNIEVFLKQMNQ